MSNCYWSAVERADRLDVELRSVVRYSNLISSVVRVAAAAVAVEVWERPLVEMDIEAWKCQPIGLLVILGRDDRAEQSVRATQCDD